jgi:predicted type IV restriction endonuclease
MGQFVTVEERTATGRIDAVVITDNTVFIFEFKMIDRSSTEEAIKQIDNKGYTIPYSAGNRKIVKVGVEFSLEKRGVTNWKEE